MDDLSLSDKLQGGMLTLKQIKYNPSAAQQTKSFIEK